MNSIQCQNSNGTYVCAMPKGHDGAHQVTEYRRNSRGIVHFYITTKWADSYGPVKQIKGFA